MFNEFQIYESLYYFIEKKMWIPLHKRVVAVRVPNTKRIYYVTVEVIENQDLVIMIYKGIDGFISLRQWKNPVARKRDSNPRNQCLVIGFDLEAAEMHADDFYNNFNGLGYPTIYDKPKGLPLQELSEDQVEDLNQILEALATEGILQNLKNASKIYKAKTIMTLFKKEGKWQREKQPIELTPKDESPLEIGSHKFNKEIDQIDDTWYLTSLYDDEALGRYDEAFHPCTLYLGDGKGNILKTIEGISPKREEIELKQLFLETIMTLKKKPVEVITDLENIYYAFKSFLKELKIEIKYHPEDNVLKDMLPALPDNEDTYDYGVQLDEGILEAFLRVKDISKDTFEQMTKNEKEKILKALDDLMAEIRTVLDEHFLEKPILERVESSDVQSQVKYILSVVEKEMNRIYKK